MEKVQGNNAQNERGKFKAEQRTDAEKQQAIDRVNRKRTGKENHKHMEVP